MAPSSPLLLCLFLSAELFKAVIAGQGAPPSAASTTTWTDGTNNSETVNTSTVSSAIPSLDTDSAVDISQGTDPALVIITTFTTTTTTVTGPIQNTQQGSTVTLTTVSTLDIPPATDQSIAAMSTGVVPLPSVTVQPSAPTAVTVTTTGNVRTINSKNLNPASDQSTSIQLPTTPTGYPVSASVCSRNSSTKTKSVDTPIITDKLFSTSKTRTTPSNGTALFPDRTTISPPTLKSSPASLSSSSSPSSPSSSPSTVGNELNFDFATTTVAVPNLTTASQTTTTLPGLTAPTVIPVFPCPSCTPPLNAIILIPLSLFPPANLEIPPPAGQTPVFIGADGLATPISNQSPAAATTSLVPYGASFISSPQSEAPTSASTSPMSTILLSPLSASLPTASATFMKITGLGHGPFVNSTIAASTPPSAVATYSTAISNLPSTFSTISTAASSWSV